MDRKKKATGELKRSKLSTYLVIETADETRDKVFGSFGQISDK